MMTIKCPMMMRMKAIVASAVMMMIIIISSFTVSNDAFDLSSRSTSRPKPYCQSHRKICMDDEVARYGIKQELTTNSDQYFDQTFRKLSTSGHNLTPYTKEELKHSQEHQEERRSHLQQYQSIHPFLGANMKGLYVHTIGGLPLFSSGSRVDAACSPTTLVFEEPCDNEHLIDQIYCARTGRRIGEIKEDGRYYIPVENLYLLPIHAKWPVESQPENFWGTEGQYAAWNSNERISKPLSY